MARSSSPLPPPAHLGIMPRTPSLRRVQTQPLAYHNSHPNQRFHWTNNVNTNVIPSFVLPYWTRSSLRRSSGGFLWQRMPTCLEPFSHGKFGGGEKRYQGCLY
ncbi:hypothetical protein V8C37DRAFT_391438 [Trichoderma ceciliae]